MPTGLRSPAPTSIRLTGTIDAIFADGRFTANSANPMDDLKFTESEMVPSGQVRHGRREVYAEGYAHCISVLNELARKRPNNAEPIRRKPSDMLAGFIDLGEGSGVPSKLRPDSFMTVTSRSQTQDRYCGQIGPIPCRDRAQSQYPVQIMVTISHRGN